jgi:tungstate transport system ATP-binding protein
MLAARDLRHRYRGTTVLDVPALELAAGEVTALVGPNGSGKSTLLRLLAFVERPSRGTLMLDGHAVATDRDRRAARRLVTLVEQHPLLFDLTVLENLRYARRLHGEKAIKGDVGRTKAMEALDRLGVADLADRPARRLSGGETQRVALARALLLRPRVLLLDEPLSAADRSARNALSEMVEQLRGAGVTVCLSSHQLEDAYRWSTRLLALADGALSPVTPENLFRTVVPAGSGARVVRAGPLELMVVTDKTGPATLAISPDDLVVSRAPLRTSVRNQFPGRVVAVSDDGRGHVRLTVDAGTELVARITPAALADLGLTVGSPVVLGVKAMAVRVF